VHCLFFLHLLRHLIFFLKKYVLHSPCWMQSALRLFTFYTIFTSCIATKRPPMTLRSYQPVAWVLYRRVINQSKADIFIKPGIKHYVINFVGNMWEVCCFMRVLRVSSFNKIDRHDTTEILMKVALNTIMQKAMDQSNYIFQLKKGHRRHMRFTLYYYFMFLVIFNYKNVAWKIIDSHFNYMFV